MKRAGLLFFLLLLLAGVVWFEWIWWLNPHLSPGEAAYRAMDVFVWRVKNRVWW